MQSLQCFPGRTLRRRRRRRRQGRGLDPGLRQAAGEGGGAEGEPHRAGAGGPRLGNGQHGGGGQGRKVHPGGGGEAFKNGIFFIFYFRFYSKILLWKGHFCHESSPGKRF